MKLKNKIKKILNLFKRGDVVLTLVLTLGILGVINFISYQIFFRADLTQNRLYSISDVSKKTAHNLDDIVKIDLYFSDNLPSGYLKIKQEVDDILKEYVYYSNGNIKVNNINLKSLEDAEGELRELGIPQIQFNVLKNDSYQVTNGYMGISFYYNDNNEAIPFVKDTKDLEYKITTAIKKVIREELPVIGIVSSHKTLDKEDGFSKVYIKLQEIYDIKDVDLVSEEIPFEVETLLIIGPKEKFNEEELKKIDKFLMEDKSLVILSDGINVLEGLASESNNNNLNELLNAYGLTLNNDIVLDGKSQGRVAFNSFFGQFSTPYPAWVKIIGENFNHDNPMVSDLESAIFPWPSSIGISDTKEAKVDFLIKSTKYSWLADENYDLNPSSGLKTTGVTKQYNIAVLLSGKINSAFDQGNSENAKLVLVGDSDFIDDQFVGSNPGNIILAQNLIDGVSLDGDLIKIRSKQSSDISLKEISDSGKQIIKYANIFGLAVVVVIFGVFRYYFRKRRKK